MSPQKFQFNEYLIIRELPRPSKTVQVREYAWSVDKVRLFILQDNLLISLTRKATARRLSVRPLQIKRLRPSDIEKIYQVCHVTQQSRKDI